MSFRGRGGGGGGFGGGRGGGRGRGGGGRGGGFRGRGGRGGGGRFEPQGPPETVREFGTYSHPCEDMLVVKSEIEEVPYFNAPIYLENKEQIGKVDEILGSIRDYYISVQLSENYKANSFPIKQKLYINPEKLLPLQRFLPRPPGSVQKRGGRGGRGAGGRGGGRGGFGGRGGSSFGGRGGGRGGGGGFGGRGSFGGRGGGRGGGGGFNGRGGGGFRGRGGY